MNVGYVVNGYIKYPLFKLVKNGIGNGSCKETFHYFSLLLNCGKMAPWECGMDIKQSIEVNGGSLPLQPVESYQIYNYASRWSRMGRSL